jgi:hypothetical protein
VQLVERFLLKVMKNVIFTTSNHAFDDLDFRATSTALGLARLVSGSKAL